MSLMLGGLGLGKGGGSLGLSCHCLCFGRLCSRTRGTGIFQLGIEIMMLEPGENLVLFNKAASVNTHVFQPARDLWTDCCFAMCDYVPRGSQYLGSSVTGLDCCVCYFDFRNTDRGGPISVSNGGGS